ncbi:MAG: DNA polymerase III subunit delta [Oscillospiraceae bacterium]
MGRSNDNMLTLTNELDKLCAYCAGRAITREDIDRCGMADLNASIFDISKAILKGDYQLTMQRLNDLIEQREEPIAILAVLSSAFIDLYRARAARPLSVPQAQLAGLFHYKARNSDPQRHVGLCPISGGILRRAILLGTDRSDEKHRD